MRQQARWLALFKRPLARAWRPGSRIGRSGDRPQNVQDGGSDLAAGRPVYSGSGLVIGLVLSGPFDVNHAMGKMRAGFQPLWPELDATRASSGLSLDSTFAAATLRRWFSKITTALAT